jgi:hypothetical protein
VADQQGSGAVAVGDGQEGERGEQSIGRVRESAHLRTDLEVSPGVAAATPVPRAMSTGRPRPPCVAPRGQAGCPYDRPCPRASWGVVQPDA